MKKEAKLSNFGKIVKIKLIELDMTQVELAEKLGIKKQYLWKVLNNERPGSRYFESIKNILGLDVAA